MDTVALSFILIILTHWENHFEDFFKNEYPHIQTIEAYIGYASIPFVVDQLASTLLIYGAVKERKGFVLPWLIAGGTLMGFFVAIGVLVAIYVGFACVLLIALGMAFAGFASGGICWFLLVGFAVYAWLCVGAYYKQLRDGEFGGSRAVYTTVAFNKE